MLAFACIECQHYPMIYVLAHIEIVTSWPGCNNLLLLGLWIRRAKMTSIVVVNFRKLKKCVPRRIFDSGDSLHLQTVNMLFAHSDSASPCKAEFWERLGLLESVLSRLWVWPSKSSALIKELRFARAQNEWWNISVGVIFQARSHFFSSQQPDSGSPRTRLSQAGVASNFPDHGQNWKNEATKFCKIALCQISEKKFARGREFY